MKFRVAVGQLREISDEDLAFAHQIGVAGIGLNKPNLESAAWIAVLGKQFPASAAPRPPLQRWEALDLIAIRSYVESAGLALECIEGVPRNFLELAMLGLPGAEQQIENFKHTIRSMGQAGIPVLGYNWIPDQVWRTSRAAPGRGGAKVTAYDHALAEGVASGALPGRDDAAMWANYERFIQAVLPVAEEAGVVLALHPDDPPVPMLDGVARIMRSPEAFARALAIGDSANHKLTFCMGCFAQMGTAQLYEGLERFGAAGKIAYVHFRNVQGCLPVFAECFVDEGEIDVARALRILRDVGFDGFVIDDHVPHMSGDTVWGHRGRAYATGYIKGMCRMLEALG
jgi:mannonate dehydratase